MNTSDRTEAQFICDCAARKLSKNHTAQLLGLWPQKLDVLIEALGLGDIEWPAKGKSFLARKQLSDVHDARRGTPLKKEYAEQLAHFREMIPRRRYTAFGVTATLPELARQFGVVHRETVRRRVNSGMEIEEALTLPATLPTAGPDHPWRIMDRQGYLMFEAKREARLRSQQGAAS